MRKSELTKLATERVLVLDGAMGTMIPASNGLADLLCLSKPNIIKDIHRAYVDAGADIITTCTFNSNAISMRDYDSSDICYEISKAGASIAREVAKEYLPKRNVLVAGSIGPTNKAASMSPDISDPAKRDVEFDDLYNAYSTQIKGLLDGGVDILLFETAFDTINLKAGLKAAADELNERGEDCAIMVSLTLSSGGRTLSGQSLAAFITTIKHAPFVASIGLNCSFGAEQMLPYLKELAKLAPNLVSAYPNAGLPDEFGNYAATPELMADAIKSFLDLNLVNIIGGCCGTTPGHIRKIAELAKAAIPHSVELSEEGNTLFLAGLEELQVKRENNFVSIGERCNVAGSRKFLRLIKEKKYDEALSIARKQVQDGAQILDINIDDGMLDSKAEMKHFINLLMSDPEIATLPIMIDSSDRGTITTALKAVQGKPIVNSISLKNGEEAFVAEARAIRDMGAAVVVMAFDEEGQATTYERKIEICNRAYHILTEKVNFSPNDIIFDPNILTIATGIEEHDAFAADFIKATAWIKENLPGAKVSGGVSNLSFAFRGNNYIREAMHAVFLYHAINAGMDMAIINPSTSVTYNDIHDDLRTLIEDVVLNRRKGSADELAEAAKAFIAEKQDTVEVVVDRSTTPVAERLQQMIIHGDTEHLDNDLQEALNTYSSAMSIIEGPLLDGMNRVGDLFGEGKMFLPQVVKAARTMNKAVEFLRPAIDSASRKGAKSGTIVIATVKGDVHDIGKNIVSIVLKCNNYEVVDLGVMVPASDIVAKAVEVNADIICLSGLITPSLAEMAKVADEMERAGLRIPLFVGGATTSRLHTAVKIAPHYSGPVLHISDAARNPIAAARLLNPETHDAFVEELNMQYEEIRREHELKQVNLISLKDARSNALHSDYSAPTPMSPGRTVVTIPINEVLEFINWKYFFNAWKLSGNHIGCSCSEHNHELEHETEHLKYDAVKLLSKLSEDSKPHIKAIVGLYKAKSKNDDILIDGELRLPMLRRQQSGEDEKLSLADYIQPLDSDKSDYIGIFAVTAGAAMEEYYAHFEAEGDTYGSLLLQSLCDRLAEASAEWLHCKVRRELWGYAPEENLTVEEMWQNRHQGIRPAVGYPSIPDQTLMHILNNKLHLDEIGVSLTENGAMSPTATVSGLYIANPDAKYFMIGKIGDDQLSDYATRRKLDAETVKSLLHQ